MRAVESMLAEHPFVEGLSPAHLEILKSGAAIARFDEGEFIFREHETARHFYLIVEGCVALKIHVPQTGPIPIQTLAPGQALGWSWLVPPYKWHFDARAFTPVKALTFDAATLRRAFEETPELGYQMFLRINRALAERLQATRLQLLDVYQCGIV